MTLTQKVMQLRQPEMVNTTDPFEGGNLKIAEQLQAQVSANTMHTPSANIRKAESRLRPGKCSLKNVTSASALPPHRTAGAVGISGTAG
eukprot:6483131-Amphidinium_carterae.4